MNVLLENEFITVTMEDGGVVRARRTPEPIPDVARFLAFVEPFQLAVPLRERPRLRLLMDMRAAPMNNDPEREEQIATHVQRIQEGFPKIAVLVRTAVGRLQINRIKRETETAAVVFDNEAEALAFLLDGAPRASRAKPGAR